MLTSSPKAGDQFERYVGTPLASLLYVHPVVVEPIALTWMSGLNGKLPNIGLWKSIPRLCLYTKSLYTAISRFLGKLPGRSIFSPYVKRKFPLTSSGVHTKANFGANTPLVPIASK